MINNVNNQNQRNNVETSLNKNIIIARQLFNTLLKVDDETKEIYEHFNVEAYILGLIYSKEDKEKDKDKEKEKEKDKEKEDKDNYTIAIYRENGKDNRDKKEQELTEQIKITDDNINKKNNKPKEKGEEGKTEKEEERVGEREGERETEREGERETEREGERDTEREGEKETERESERETEREKEREKERGNFMGTFNFLKENPLHLKKWYEALEIYKEKEELYELFLTIFPKSTYYWKRFAESQIRKKEYINAYNIYRKAIDSNIYDIELIISFLYFTYNTASIHEYISFLFEALKLSGSDFRSGEIWIELFYILLKIYNTKFLVTNNVELLFNDPFRNINIYNTNNGMNNEKRGDNVLIPSEKEQEVFKSKIPNSYPKVTYIEHYTRDNKLKKFYEQWFNNPTNYIEKMWNFFCMHERSSNNYSSGFLAAYSSQHMNAQNVYKKLCILYKKLNLEKKRKRKIIIPITKKLKANNRILYFKWMNIINYEKSNPLKLNLSLVCKRIMYTYEQALMNLQFNSDLWFSYFQFLLLNRKYKYAIRIMREATEVYLPLDDLLKLNFAYFFEFNNLIYQAHYIYHLMISQVVKKRDIYKIDCLIKKKKIFYEKQKRKKKMKRIFLEKETAADKSMKTIMHKVKRFKINSTSISKGEEEKEKEQEEEKKIKEMKENLENNETEFKKNEEVLIENEEKKKKEIYVQEEETEKNKHKNNKEACEENGINQIDINSSTFHANEYERIGERKKYFAKYIHINKKKRKHFIFVHFLNFIKRNYDETLWRYYSDLIMTKEKCSPELFFYCANVERRILKNEERASYIMNQGYAKLGYKMKFLFYYVQFLLEKGNLQRVRLILLEHIHNIYAKLYKNYERKSKLNNELREKNIAVNKYYEKATREKHKKKNYFKMKQKIQKKRLKKNSYIGKKEKKVFKDESEYNLFDKRYLYLLRKVNNRCEKLWNWLIRIEVFYGDIRSLNDIFEIKLKYESGYNLEENKNLLFISCEDSVEDFNENIIVESKEVTNILCKGFLDKLKKNEVENLQTKINLLNSQLFGGMHLEETLFFFKIEEGMKPIHFVHNLLGINKHNGNIDIENIHIIRSNTLTPLSVKKMKKKKKKGVLRIEDNGGSENMNTEMAQKNKNVKFKKSCKKKMLQKEYGNFLIPLRDPFNFYDDLDNRDNGLVRKRKKKLKEKEKNKIGKNDNIKKNKNYVTFADINIMQTFKTVEDSELFEKGENENLYEANETMNFRSDDKKEATVDKNYLLTSNLINDFLSILPSEKCKLCIPEKSIDYLLNSLQNLNFPKLQKIPYEPIPVTDILKLKD